MDDSDVTLTPAEWNVMECLWESEAPLTGREVTERLAKAVGWSRSTALTMLSRMEKKGLVACAETDGMKHYRPMIDRDKALKRQNSEFLNRVYKGSVAELLSAFTEQENLSASELDELYAILDKVKEWRL